MKTQEQLLRQAKETGKPVVIIGDKTNFWRGKYYKDKTTYYPNGNIKTTKFYM